MACHQILVLTTACHADRPTKITFAEMRDMGVVEDDRVVLDVVNREMAEIG